MIELKPRRMEGFLCEGDVEVALNYCRSAQWGELVPGNFWAGRTINFSAVDGPVAEVMNRFALGARDFIVREYGETEIYADTMDLVRWPPGSSQPPHCDDMSDSEERKPKFEHRKFGCIVYLNDDYSGGFTYYPELKMETVPKRGMIAVHPGNCENRHGVTEVSGVTRYTIASFWTSDRQKAMRGIFW